MFWAATGNFDFDYGFYQLLRFVAFFAFGFAAFISYKKDQQIVPFALGFLAIVFNPFIPIYLEREIWQWVDILGGFFLIFWTVFTYNYDMYVFFKKFIKINKKHIIGAFSIFAVMLLLYFGKGFFVHQVEEPIVDVNGEDYSAASSEPVYAENIETDDFVKDTSISDNTTTGLFESIKAKPPTCNFTVAPNGIPYPTKSGYLRKMPVRDLTGLSTLTIDNSQNDSDVYVKLFNISGQYVSRNFLVKAYDKYKIVDINQGNYTVKAKFLNDCSFTESEEFEIKENQIYDGVEYSNISMTLYKVANGNLDTKSIDENEFDRGN